MPLKNDNDLSLTAGGTTYYFDLYPHVPQPYRHYFEDLVPTIYTLSGNIGFKNLDPRIIFWDMPDWSGGEGTGISGQIIYSPDLPNVYDTFDGNPRLPNRITAHPTRTDGNIVSGLSATLGTTGYFATAGGSLWFAANQGGGTPALLERTTDTTTWTAATPVGANDGVAVPDSRAFFVTGMTGKGDYTYVSLSQSINMTGSGLHLRRIDTAGNNVLFAEAAAANDTKGMASLQQYLYRWTGQKLSQYDTTGALPLTGTIVYSAGLDVTPSTVYAGCCATDFSVVMFWAKTGHTEVHEYLNGTGSSILTLPEGFTGRAIGFLLGSIFIAGTYKDGSAVVFGYNMRDRQPFEVGYLRRGVTLTPVSVTPGMGTQLLIGTSEGYVFVRDASSGAVTLLDQVTGNGDALLGTWAYQNYRIASLRDNANTRFRRSVWAEDTDVPTNGTFTLDSGEWDMDLSMEPFKVLMGVHVRSSTLTATKTVEIQYSVDGGSFASLGSKTSGSTNYFPASDSSNTISGGKYRFKLLGASSGGSNAPIVYRVTPRYENWNWREKWDIYVRIGGSQGERGTDEDPEPSKVRNWLRTLMHNRTLVAFTDGCITDPNASPPTDTTTCIIKDMEDWVDHRSNGYALLTLQNVSPT